MTHFFKISKGFLSLTFGSKEKVLLICFLLALCNLAYAQDENVSKNKTLPKDFSKIALSKLDDGQSIKKVIFYYGGAHTDTFEQVRAASQGQWQSAETSAEDYPHAQGWFKIEAVADYATSQFVIKLPLISEAEAYLVQKGIVKAKYEGGEFVAADKKVIKSGRKDFLIPLYVVEEGDFQLIVRATNLKEESIDLDWRLQQYTAWSWAVFESNLKDAIFHTIVWVVILSNIMLFYLFSRKTYLYYSGYLATVSLYFLWNAGHIGNFILTQTPSFSYSLKTLQNIAPIFYWLFLTHFDSKKDFFGKRVKTFYTVVALNILVVALECTWILFIERYPLLLSHLANLVSCASMLLASVLFLCCNWKKNSQGMLVSAGVFIVALSYLLTLVYFYMSESGYSIIFKIGFLGEVFLFTLSLIFQFRHVEREKISTQKNLIAELRKNKALQDQHNRELEQKVADRTREIELKNEEIVDQRNELLNNSSELHELNSELLTQAETIQATNERLHKNEQILKRAYERLKETQKELKQKNEAIQKINKDQEKIIASRNRGLLQAKKELDDFLYRTSHNLKGPVARIKGLQELLKIELKDNVYVEEYLDRLNKVIEKMEIVFEKLNAVSYINKAGTKEESCNLAEVVSNTVSNLADKIADRNAEVIEDTQAIDLNVSPKIIGIILKYLLENALQFKEKKRPLKIEVHVSEQENSFIKLIVKDNGSGIEDKVIGKIFNMFYIGSLDSEGDGLGLYIVKKAVEKLHGFINVESKYREGTTIRILLPKTAKIKQGEIHTSHKISPL